VGGYANTWTYTGYNNTNGNILNKTTDLVGVNQTTGSIFVSNSKPPGSYQVKIVGNLPDFTTYSEIFTITVIYNTPPKFLNSM
jgi:hypothetical protein